MTSKERAALRGQANTIEPLFQVGKGGLSDTLISQVVDALNKRELIKLKVLLESSPITPREAADEIAKQTDSEVIQVVGGSMIFYKYNPELHQAEKTKSKKNSTKTKGKPKKK
ncbi:hypothetical protein SDC9_129458 [bioreactor metagenome]|uniref:CRM domain-containing protein n=1 Tax=bioreactor metagenome TaxID=1076179 RepID=A0A645CZN5_9ZZZZ